MGVLTLFISLVFRGYMQVQENRLDDTSLFFNILKKSNSTWISPEDFLPVLEGNLC